MFKYDFFVFFNLIPIYLKHKLIKRGNKMKNVNDLIVKLIFDNE